MPLASKVRKALNVFVTLDKSVGGGHFTSFISDVRKNLPTAKLSQEDMQLMHDILDELERVEKEVEIKLLRIKLSELEIAYNKLLPSSNNLPVNVGTSTNSFSAQ